MIVPDLVRAHLYEMAEATALAKKKEYEKALETLELLKKRSEIRCGKCKESFPIATQVFVQTHWYTSPHGCTGGDYWNVGEANWTCPACRTQNRFDKNISRTAYGEDFIKKIERNELCEVSKYFKRVVQCYCEYNRGRCAACADEEKLAKKEK